MSGRSGARLVAEAAAHLWCALLKGTQSKLSRHPPVDLSGRVWGPGE